LFSGASVNYIVILNFRFWVFLVVKSNCKELSVYINK
jgi:hypothetical protein